MVPENVRCGVGALVCLMSPDLAELAVLPHTSGDSAHGWPGAAGEWQHDVGFSPRLSAIVYSGAKIEPG